MMQEYIDMLDSKRSCSFCFHSGVCINMPQIDNVRNFDNIFEARATGFNVWHALEVYKIVQGNICIRFDPVGCSSQCLNWDKRNQTK